MPRRTLRYSSASGASYRGELLRKNDQAPAQAEVSGERVRTPRETFLSFVDTLAAALDEPGVDGELLAARMHLSRSHLDRILTAAAGEPPARLRRRILLERAAYRLATSEAGVLDVAIQAGYSSNEAFTRAFERAFGAAPSAWRRSPGAGRRDRSDSRPRTASTSTHPAVYGCRLVPREYPWI